MCVCVCMCVVCMYVWCVCVCVCVCMGDSHTVTLDLPQGPATGQVQGYTSVDMWLWV